jgi:hypothetical protein
MVCSTFLILVYTLEECGAGRNRSSAGVAKKSRGAPGQGRGRRISAPDRRETLQLIEDAVAAGARRAQACAELGLSLRSLQRRQHCERSASFGTTS